jgi:hypothetical protein
LITVVTVRSYSRNSGATRDEIETASPAFSSALPMRSSGRGFRKE